MGISEQLSAAVVAKRSPLVLGLDPRPERMPPAFRDGAHGIVRFHERLIGLLRDFVVAIKPQSAFFELLDEDAFAAWRDTCAMGRDAGLCVIGDVKRGDIGSTATAYAEAHFRHADVLTVHPYLGDDSIDPFLAHCTDGGRGIFVLCATSNPGWRRFQAIEDRQGRPLWSHVADAIAEWNDRCRAPDAPLGPVGAVVGATHPDLLVRARSAMPASWLLLPGVGAQGASAADVAPAFLPDGTGALLPVSRGLASCFEPGEVAWESAVVAAAAAILAEVRAGVPALCL